MGRNARGIVSIDAGPIAEEHAAAEEANALRRLDAREQTRVLDLEKRKTVDPTGAFGEIQRATLPAYFYDVRKAVGAATWLTGDANLEVMRLGYEPVFGSLHTFIRGACARLELPCFLYTGARMPSLKQVSLRLIS